MFFNSLEGKNRTHASHRGNLYVDISMYLSPTSAAIKSGATVQPQQSRVEPRLRAA